MRDGSVQLGEALEFVYGKNLPKSSRADGSIPVYGSNGVAGWHDTALVDEPTVIVGRKGSAGAVQYVDQPCFPIDTTYFVRPQGGYAFDMKFVYYLLRHLNLSRLATATGVPGLTREDAYRERITVLRIGEQRRIADLLSRAQGIVRLCREAERKAAQLIPAIFLDMFGDPAANPKRWPMAGIESLCSVQTGATPHRKEVRYFDSGTIPWIKTTLVTGDPIASAEDYITESAVAETNCKIFRSARFSSPCMVRGRRAVASESLKLPLRRIRPAQPSYPATRSAENFCSMHCAFNTSGCAQWDVAGIRQI